MTREFQNWSQDSLERLSKNMSDCNCKTAVNKELAIRAESEAKAEQSVKETFAL